jgi:carbamoyltransferase
MSDIAEKTLVIYGSHDASVTFIDKNRELRIFEYERFVKRRYSMFSSSFDNRKILGSNQSERIAFLELIKSNLYDEDITKIVYLELTDEDKELMLEYFPSAKFEIFHHHLAHANGAYHLSNFDDALIFSVDGGGMDYEGVSSINVYYANHGEISRIHTSSIDYGRVYQSIGDFLSDIRKDPTQMTYAGKIMGLCAYGKVREEWLDSCVSFFKKSGSIGVSELIKELGLPEGDLSNSDAWDLAATHQKAFEVVMHDLVWTYYRVYPKNIVLTGGCALNVLFNQQISIELSKRGHSVFVPPNPNDCGLTHGWFLHLFPEYKNRDSVYSGIHILDESNLEKYLNEYEHENLTYERLVDLLLEGKILGVIKGDSEIGPRALGNRSIVCYPAFENMKDILNSKVKFREWYRPFAPVCRSESMHVFFNDALESPYMSYAPFVKDQYVKELSSIVHVDKTARLQTVTEKTHILFNEILIELQSRGRIPVILNTSFNIRGNPILTSYEDAFYVLDTTELDCVITENYIFHKKRR